MHNVAVETFLTAGDSVTLTVIQNVGHFDRTVSVLLLLLYILLLKTSICKTSVVLF